VIPHITNEIKSRIKSITKSKNTDVAIIELGGTVGDIEGLPYIESIRQMKKDAGPENVLYIHLTLVPFIRAAGEIKTKPTQHSVSTLLSLGIQPDILLCRTEKKLTKGEREKISLFCNVDINSVIQALDVSTIYEVPKMFHSQGLDDIIAGKLGLKAKKIDLTKWNSIVRRIKAPVKRTTIAVVGKYTDVQDAYKSIKEAILHGGIANNAGIDFKWVDSELLEKPANTVKFLSGINGILVPGGFGVRGIEGKVNAVKYAREKRIPFFGICLGMQSAVIEFARNVLGMKAANSTEFNRETKYPVISLLEEQKNVKDMGASMRLGSYPCRITRGTLAEKAYGEKVIFERHRHRYEFNNFYREKFENRGMKVSGSSPDGSLVEMVELQKHPWFVAVQFHPEFKSRPGDCHPLFRGFIKAAVNLKH